MFVGQTAPSLELWWKISNDIENPRWDWTQVGGEPTKDDGGNNGYNGQLYSYDANNQQLSYASKDLHMLAVVDENTLLKKQVGCLMIFTLLFCFVIFHCAALLLVFTNIAEHLFLA